jgi:ketosteroid isomerase-like protein
VRNWGLLVVMAALAGVASAETSGPTPATLVAVEREFAADAQARGWIAAFKRYAAADAVWFQPDPINAQASLADEPDEPAVRTLKWWPVWAGIAKSGDLGFTMGPYTSGETRFGHFFTVWAKQRDGAWRWLYDGGPRNEVKSPLGPETEPAHFPVSTASSVPAEKSWSEVASIEVDLANAAHADSKAAYFAHLSEDARLMGSPAQPAIGRAALAAELDRRATSIAFAPLGGRASGAGDLVFTYGKATWVRDGVAGRGHYVRIWQKRGKRWLLAFDELLVVPPPKPAP